MFAFVIILILVRAVCAQLCSECQCCANGRLTNCENGYCNNGCIDGYYGDNCYYKCRIQNCLKCDRINGNYCSKCITGYFLNNKYCHECGPHCSSCEPTGCQSCQNGYYGNNCQWSCAAHCTTCKNWNDFCQSCEPGYYLQTNYCRECGTQCSSCDINGCQSCNNGYFGNTCKWRCAAHCTSCQKSDGYCNSCESGYYLKNNHCYNCGTRCSLCETNGCQSCMDGYFGNTCEWRCAAHCVSCRKSDGYCNSCKSGYYLENNYCFNCESHCASCESNVCKACFDGFWGSTCEHRCGHHCSSCNQRNGVCISCEDGYWGSPCTTCGSQCRVCNQSSGCLECNAGYKCGKYNCHGCKECREGYFKHDSYCHECKYKLDGCTCTSYGECSGCIEGYFLNPVFCAECLDPCTSCINHSICTSCIPGRFGQTCQHGCSQYCKNGICEEKNARCRCYPNYKGEMCDQCEDGRYGDNCDELCSTWCEFGTCLKDTGFCPCKPGRYGNKCQSTCPTGCLNDICNRSDGSCHSCKKGYVGDLCNITCPSLCNSCDQFGACTECKQGYSNEQNQCTCKKDMCVNQLNCKSCTNTSFFANGGDCCLCILDNCVSCSKALDTVICKICQNGYYPNINGECELCKSQCVNNECDTSSGECYQGCTNGYWNKTCDKSCDPECLSCSQPDGSCTHCKNNTKYGPNCSMKCSSNCKKSMCGINGDCTNGCIINKFGKQCEQTCENYCTQKENRTVCSEKTGMCLYGCNKGGKGSFCPSAQAGKQMSTALLGGGVGGGVVALAAIVVVGLILLRSRRGNLSNRSEQPGKEHGNSSALYATVNKGRAHYANEDTDNLHSVTIIENTNHQSPPPKSSDKENTRILTEDHLEIEADDVSAREITDMFESNDVVYYNNTREISKCKLTVVDLPDYVQNICIKDLEEEFQKVPYGLVKPYEVSQTKLNMHRNRYKGIYPYDDTRVLVRGGDTDYINASYIDGFRKRNAYIATLGPMAKQLGDFGQFWRMVWQQKVEKIVMVTNLVESLKTKCEQYWPDHGQRNLYGDTEVVCKVEKKYADFIWRQLTISKGKKNSEERNLHHLQFTAWPDKDIPDNVTSIIEFRQKVNALPSTFDGPVLVHCSAGVGRTGTYIALDILTNEGEAEGAIDIPGCVFNMRQNRPSMIQTLSQYKYLHEALVHSLTLDCSLIKREHFHEYMNVMSSKQEIQKQFEKMQLNQEQKSDQELQAMEKVRLLAKKNRKHADIPGDSNRPRLHMFMKPGESDYINAIYINSFKTKNRFLVAQTPLPDTVSDFITLAVQENCSCIVSMETQGIGLYVPDDNILMKKGLVSILSTRDQSTKHFVKRTLHFEHDEKTKSEFRIPHYEYLNWDRSHNTPKSTEHFVAFIKEVADASKSSHMNGPILVHCMNGAGKSGLLCVVLTLLETLSEYNEVSVVNAVRKVRARRPLSIPNKEQFYFCYECVLQSLNATDNDVYYNTSRDVHRE